MAVLVTVHPVFILVTALLVFLAQIVNPLLWIHASQALAKTADNATLLHLLHLFVYAHLGLPV